MALARLTNIFQVATEPTNLADARIHTGGWSESIWTTEAPATINPFWLTQETMRARILPKTASIVGFRRQEYTIAGNKLIPGGASTGRANFPGNLARVTDLPQVALQLSCETTQGPNVSRLVLRGMPDDTMIGGEYQPNADMKTRITNYINSLNNPALFGFVGRDLTQASVRVMKIVSNVVTVSAVPVGLNVGDFIRFHRVYDDNGDPVKGAWPITAIAGVNLTVAALDREVSFPSGSLRKDQLAYFPFGPITPVRAVVKKIGRPSEQYRGRRSKQRA